MMARFCENSLKAFSSWLFLQKISIIDALKGLKYTSDYFILFGEALWNDKKCFGPISCSTKNVWLGVNELNIKCKNLVIFCI